MASSELQEVTVTLPSREALLDLPLTADAIVIGTTSEHRAQGILECDRVVAVGGVAVTNRADARGVAMATPESSTAVVLTVMRAAGNISPQLVDLLPSDAWDPMTQSRRDAMAQSLGRSPQKDATAVLSVEARAALADMGLLDEESSSTTALLDFSAATSSVESLDTAARFRNRVGTKIDQLLPGRVLVMINDAGVNPVEQLIIAARQRSASEPVVVDCGDKISRGRVTADSFTALFKEAMLSGRWFFMMKASKSMTLLTQLASLVVEMREHRLEGLHRDARIIVSSEPHPHFPMALLDGGTTVRVKNAEALASLVLASITHSSSLRREVFGTPKERGRVTLNTLVTVVSIDPRDIAAEAHRETPVTRYTPPPSATAAPVFLTASYRGLPGDCFYGLSYSAAGDGTIGVSSSQGNIFIVDADGACKMSFHAHDAAVWDVSFAPDGTIVTGGEDGLGVWWGRDAREPDALFCRDVVRVPNDVYAIRHTSSGAAVGLGGYLPYLLVRSAGGVSREVLMSTAVQAIAAVPGSETLLCAGSDGTVTAVDAEAGATLWSASRHVKKCPCVATNGAHTVVSGSYDGTVKVWDARAPQTSSTAAIKFTGAVTGVASSGEYMAACVGQGLHLWDMRNTSQALSSVAQAWKGSSRGIVMDGGSKTVVTASPDGVTRFWSFQ